MSRCRLSLRGSGVVGYRGVCSISADDSLMHLLPIVGFWIFSFSPGLRCQKGLPIRSHIQRVYLRNSIVQNRFFYCFLLPKGEEQGLGRNYWLWGGIRFQVLAASNKNGFAIVKWKVRHCCLPPVCVMNWTYNKVSW